MAAVLDCISLNSALTIIYGYIPDLNSFLPTIKQCRVVRAVVGLGAQHLALHMSLT